MFGEDGGVVGYAGAGEVLVDGLLHWLWRDGRTIAAELRLMRMPWRRLEYWGQEVAMVLFDSFALSATL